MSERNYKMTKLACYSAYFTMSSIFCLPPLLFVIFHESYGISWTLLGTLVLTNFCTQLAVDLIFTLFSKRFNVALVVRVMPIITATGMLIYALSPLLFPNAVYVGLLIGTVIFSVSAGLSEVLLSPLIAAIPSKNPQRDMSLLHSLYAFGVFFVVVVGTLSLKLVGEENWQYVTAFFALLPVIAAVLFMLSPMPDMSGGESGSTRKGGDKRNYIGIALCALCIFLGSCAENVMSNWISSFMDAHLGIDKALGDIIGVAAFAILLGITRISYAKWGKHIEKMLLVGMIGSAVCYLVAGLVTSVAVAAVACVLTGVFVAMLWPGTLILMEEKIPGVGVAAFALMAASGDLGASVAPQLMGIIADNAGLDTGMLVTAIFPTLGTILILVIIRFFGRKKDCPSLKLTESES